MNDELIERLEKLANFGQTQEHYKTIQEAITALQEMQKENKRLDAALVSVNSLLCIIESQSTSAWDKTQIALHEIQKARAGE